MQTRLTDLILPILCVTAIGARPVLATPHVAARLDAGQVDTGVLDSGSIGDDGAATIDLCRYFRSRAGSSEIFDGGDARDSYGVTCKEEEVSWLILDDSPSSVFVSGSDRRLSDMWMVKQHRDCSRTLVSKNGEFVAGRYGRVPPEALLKAWGLMASVGLLGNECCSVRTLDTGVPRVVWKCPSGNFTFIGIP